MMDGEWCGWVRAVIDAQHAHGLCLNLGHGGGLHGASSLRSLKTISYSYHLHRQAQTVLTEHGIGMPKWACVTGIY